MISKSQIKRFKAQSSAPLFKDQAKAFLVQGANRKRNPFRPETIRVYKSQIETNLNPYLGEIPLEVVGNAAVKGLAATLAIKGLSAATIELNINIIKQIRASAQDSEGAQLYPYTWNTEFIDAPEINNQKTPIASAQQVQDAINKNCGVISPLVAVLAGTGLRIGEILAITVGREDSGGNPWDGSKITVRSQRDGGAFVPTKTEAGVREIDLPEELNRYLRDKFFDGFMFPMSESYYRQQFTKCGIIGGFHSFRRFRVTHLRLQSVPESLIHFWIGHEDESVTDRYTKVGTEIESRKQWAQKAGLGFNLPETT
jgi:integrase